MNGPKPSARLNDLIEGRTSWEEADDATRSWARFHIYRGAHYVLRGEGKEGRRARLAEAPEHLRAAVEEQAIKIWKAGK